MPGDENWGRCLVLPWNDCGFKRLLEKTSANKQSKPGGGGETNLGGLQAWIMVYKVKNLFESFQINMWVANHLSLPSFSKLLQLTLKAPIIYHLIIKKCLLCFHKLSVC